VTRSISALLVCLALASAVAACGGGGSGAASTAKSTDTVVTAGTGIPAGCKKVTDPGARDEEANQKRPTGKLSGGTATVAMQTNCGAFTITLDAQRAPLTAASFATLVKRGFYDNLQFHRIATTPDGAPFVIQGGDPLGTGLGGPGYTIKEKPPSDLKYTKYTVAMARTATEPSGTSGSQFFIVTAPEAQLGPTYALVGKVTSGQDTVDRISKVPTNGNEVPIVPVVIQKATLGGATLSSGSERRTRATRRASRRGAPPGRSGRCRGRGR
jgi:peptidyl-prolyl cis-trans isomerase B (cyclophilin B)